MSVVAWLSGARRMQLDTSALRDSPQFRLLLVSQLVTGVGSMVTYVALPFQMQRLTGSYLAVGLIGLVELGPVVVLGLYGGALADTVDRRRLTFLTETALCLTSLALMVNALHHPPAVWVLYVMAFLAAAASALQRPALDAMVPRLVRGDELAGAAALSSLASTVATVAGPAIGGLLLAFAGSAAAYGADVASFVASLVVLARMAPLPPSTVRTVGAHRFMAEGLRYAASRRDLLGSYLVDLSAMFFAYPTALFPFVAAQLHAAWAVGLLYTAPFVGALLATLTSGWTARVHHHGRGILAAAAAWGLAIAAFGASPNLAWALVALVLAGAADMISGLFRSLLWNLSVPDDLRGRMAGAELLSFSIGPQLGMVRSSVVARATSLRLSLVSGGLACVGATAVLAVALPRLWGFDERVDVPEQRRRGTSTP